MIIFLINVLLALSFCIKLDIKGCPCHQIMLEKDCSHTLTACKWSNATKSCSVMPCNERPAAQCRIFDSFFHYEPEVYLCQYNVELDVCEDYVKRDCSQIEITLQADLDDEGEEQAYKQHKQTCREMDCMYDKEIKKCKELIADCGTLNKEQCTKQVNYYGTDGQIKGNCVWIQEPWKDWTGKCSPETNRIALDCSEHLSYDYCNPFSRCLWVRNKCDSYICEDLSGTLGRSYCELLYEVRNDTGFTVCVLNDEEKMCERSSPLKLNATNCQEKTYNSWFYNTTTESCEPCTELAKYRDKFSLLMVSAAVFSTMFLISF